MTPDEPNCRNAEMPLWATVALIFDATTPAGAEVARRLAARGAWVACGLRAEHDAGKRLVDTIRMDGGRALLVAGDPAGPREAWTMLQRLEAEWGEPDIVILVPPSGDSPERARTAFVNLLHGGAPGQSPARPGTRFLIALPPATADADAALAALTASVPDGVCVSGVLGASAASETGAALAELATAEPCPHGVVWGGPNPPAPFPSKEGGAWDRQTGARH